MSRCWSGGGGGGSVHRMGVSIFPRSSMVDSRRAMMATARVEVWETLREQHKSLKTYLNLLKSLLVVLVHPIVEREAQEC